MEKRWIAITREEICDEWQKADYAKNPYHPEALTIEGANGVLVASKSERDITFGLKDAELANRYEQKTRLGDRDVYPDFTIFDPTNGRVVLWEHFGKMDDENYARNTYAKIDRYKYDLFWICLYSAICHYFISCRSFI